MFFLLFKVITVKLAFSITTWTDKKALVNIVFGYKKHDVHANIFSNNW